jgi:hypothetical protein
LAVWGATENKKKEKEEEEKSVLTVWSGSSRKV